MATRSREPKPAQHSDQFLREFFVQVARRNPVVLHRITATSSFAVDGCRWRFTIPKLHGFLQHYYPSLTPALYRDFRQILYDCPVNTDLARHGCRLTIIDNQAKVDRSVYALEWSPESFGPGCAFNGGASSAP